MGKSKVFPECQFGCAEEHRDSKVYEVSPVSWDVVGMIVRTSTGSAQRDMAACTSQARTRLVVGHPSASAECIGQRLGPRSD